MIHFQIIALALVTESISIDSENLLFSRLKTDYKEQFPELIHRTRFNRRQRALQPYFLEFAKRLSMSMKVD